MTLDEILQDIYSLEDEMRAYERKYDVLSETFFESHTKGEEPPDEAWIRDWTAWASAYKVWLRRRDAYRNAVRSLCAGTLTISEMIRKGARHEPIQVPS